MLIDGDEQIQSGRRWHGHRSRMCRARAVRLVGTLWPRRLQGRPAGGRTSARRRRRASQQHRSHTCISRCRCKCLRLSTSSLRASCLYDLPVSSSDIGSAHTIMSHWLISLHTFLSSPFLPSTAPSLFSGALRSRIRNYLKEDLGWISENLYLVTE